MVVKTKSGSQKALEGVGSGARGSSYPGFNERQAGPFVAQGCQFMSNKATARKCRSPIVEPTISKCVVSDM